MIFYIKKYLFKQQVASDITCGGEWSAARNVERKKRSVDYTGLEVATCCHQFPQKALNMKRGEIYGYPMYLLKTYILPKKSLLFSPM